MKNIKKLLTILIMLLVISVPNVYAQTYEECVANCKTTYPDENSPGRVRCDADCNGATETNKENNKQHSDKVKEELTKSPVEFCAKTSIIWQIVGYIFLILKIVIPLLLIIFGVIDFSKAVMAGKDDSVKGALQSLMWRAIAAVVIFFIPTIVNVVMGFISNFAESGAKSDFKVCQTCIVDPKNCDTSKDASKK